MEHFSLILFIFVQFSIITQILSERVKMNCRIGNILYCMKKTQNNYRPSQKETKIMFISAEDNIIKLSSIVEDLNWVTSISWLSLMMTDSVMSVAPCRLGDIFWGSTSNWPWDKIWIIDLFALSNYCNSLLFLWGRVDYFWQICVHHF